MTAPEKPQPTDITIPTSYATASEQVRQAQGELTTNYDNLAPLPWLNLSDAVGMPLPRDFWVIGARPANGKALALDTPLPTPTGWTTMGAVQVGDYLFGDDGRPCRVVFVSNVLHDRACFRVSFSGGTSIVADAEHLWSLDRKGAPRHRQVWTTQQLWRSPSPKNRIPLPAPLALSDRDLPLPPYVVGAWLGDGDSAGALITCHDESYGIIEAIRFFGVLAERCNPSGLRSPRYRLGLPGLKWAHQNVQGRLLALDLLYHKHIPVLYARASARQRLELLQGLMDTDGYISATGQCVFYSTNEELADGVRELVVSLGMKPGFSRSRAKLYGKDCGPKFGVPFYPNLPVFRLQRKLVRWTKPQLRNKHLIIRRVEAVPSVPVKCVQVESPNNLYLAGEAMVPTHNTTFVLNLFDALVAKGWPTLYIGAGSEGPPKDLRRQWAALRCHYPAHLVLENRWAELPTGAVDRVFAELQRQAQDCHETAHFADAGEKLTPKVLVSAFNYAHRYHCRYVILDHIHRMRFDARSDLRRELAETTRWLRDMAAKYDMVVFVAAQLHRANSDKGPLRDLIPPTMSDLKETGTLEEDAVVGLLLHRTRRANVSAKDVAEVVKNQRPVMDIIEPETMCVRVGKHRRRGHVQDHAAFLRITTDGQLEARSSPYGNDQLPLSTRAREPGEEDGDLPF